MRRAVRYVHNMTHLLTWSASQERNVNRIEPRSSFFIDTTVLTEISESLSLENPASSHSVVKLIKITAKMALKICLKRFTMQKYLIILELSFFF